jgi:hypothetical protein
MKYRIFWTVAWLGLLIHNPAFAADSYRYLHVTIDTPWAIFIFLLFFVLSPFVIMAILYWYFAYKKNKEQNDAEPEKQSTD